MESIKEIRFGINTIDCSVSVRIDGVEYSVGTLENGFDGTTGEQFYKFIDLKPKKSIKEKADDLLVALMTADDRDVEKILGGRG